mgnify:CR=1 FL=1
MKRLPPIGTLCAVEWDDISAAINADLAEAAPIRCTTWGVLIRKADNFAVIATSLFHSKPDAKPEGDFVSIPYGTIRRVKRVST